MRPSSSPSRPRHWRVPLAILALAGLVAGAPACAAFLGDPARDARSACDKKDGPSCFLAGNLIVEKSGENAEAVRLWTRGCSVRHSPSCEALTNVKGALREQALVDGCNAGDLVACSRRAAEFSADEAGWNEARALRHGICKKSQTINSGMPGREVEGIAESCAALAKMIAAGQGGGKDEVAATKLEVLAMTLRNEAMYRHEREDDAKVLPQPAEAPAEAPKKPKKGVLIKSEKVDPTIAERAKFRRDYEARRAAREAWMVAVDSSMAAQQKEASKGDPTIPQGTPMERALASLPGGAPGASSCQTCVEGCGSQSRCSGDDFVGGRCSHLRCAAGGACAPFDTCVAECTSRVEACAKTCGDCGDPNKGVKP